MTQIKNIFSFSHSRRDQLKSCPRKYFFQYYLHWEGWLVRKTIAKSLDDLFGDEYVTDLSMRKKIAYTYKKSTGFYLYIGNAFHSQLEKLLKMMKEGKVLKDWISFHKRAVENFRSKLEESVEVQRSNEFLKKPKDYVFFVEYLNSSEFKYGYDSLPKTDWVSFIDDATELFSLNLKNFFLSGLYYSLAKVCERSDIFAVEEKFTYDYALDLNGKTVTTNLNIIPDLLVVDNGILSIYDWKTGKFSNIKMIQLEYYAFLFETLIKKGVFNSSEVSKIKMKVFSFKENKFHNIEYSSGMFDVSKFESELAEMVSLTDKGLPDNSIDPSREKEFKRKVNRGRFGCITCPYLRICNGTSQEIGI